MELRRLPVGSIIAAAYNPQKDLRPGDTAYDALEQSIKAFGIVEPLVWNERTGHLVSGHQRFKVLVAQGDAEVDVSVVNLDLEREKALNLALNKIQGAWDEPQLLDVLAGMETSLSLTGFSTSELEALSKSLTPTAFETLFTPVQTALPAKISSENVTDGWVSKEKDRLDKQFDHPAARIFMEEVYCPHCGKAFNYDVSTAYRFAERRHIQKSEDERKARELLSSGNTDAGAAEAVGTNQ